MAAPDVPNPMSTCRCDPAYAGIASQFAVPAIDLDQTMMLRITATFRKRADWRDMRMDVPWEARVHILQSAALNDWWCDLFASV